MTTESLKSLWDKHSDEEYGKFDRIERKLARRNDVHAFILLDGLLEIIDGSECHNMVSWAEHDEFWLSIDVQRLAEVITEAQVIDLMRCGVRYDTSNDALAMFT